MRRIASEDWKGCYKTPWKKHEDISPLAFRHPAKFRKGVAFRVVDYLLKEGWLKKGELVLDPTAGVGCGGIACASRGVRWMGVEIERHPVTWGNESIQCHEKTWQRQRKPVPILLCGDARVLKTLVGVTSVDAIICGPPCATLVCNNGRSLGPGMHLERHRRDIPSNDPGYGESGGQLGNMERGGFVKKLLAPPNRIKIPGHESCDERMYPPEWYGRHGSENSIGVQRGDAYWEAAELVLLQCYDLLKSGGVACWQVKNFSRNKRLVCFPHEWRMLCEKCGFETLADHRLWMVETVRRYGFVPSVQNKSYKSAARHVNEAKGVPPVDYENLIVVRKPR